MIRTVKIMVILGLLVLCGTAWCVEPIPNLIAHWTFDEGRGTTAYDSVGSNHGTIWGAQWTTGQIDGALSFDGVDDYVGLGSPANLDDLPLNNLTISAWVFAESFESWGTIIGCYVRRAGWHLRRHGTALHFQAPHQSPYVDFESSDGTISTNTWYHVVAVWDASTKTAKLYIDGTEPSYQTTTPGTGTYKSDASNNKEIGRIPHVGGVQYFNGTIDDVRIYDRALSPGEVQQLYQGGLGEMVGLEIIGPNEVAENFSASYKAIAYYDNNSTKDVTDSADWLVEPNSFASIEAGLLTTEGIDRPEEDITIYAQYTEGEVTVEAEKEVLVFAICPSGSALSFDGVDDYVEIPDDDSLTPNTEITISFWIYNIGGGTGGVYKIATCPNERYSPGNSRAYWLHVYGSPAKLELRIHSAVRDVGFISSNNSIPLYEWHHVAGTFNLGSAAVFIDGQLDNSEILPVTSIMNDAQPLMFGSFWDYCGADDLRTTLNGIMDEVAIWDRALSAEEIRANMHTRLTGDEPGLVGYWDFDEGEEQVAYDLSLYGNHGRLGSTPDADASDPAWVESDAPIGICTLEELTKGAIAEKAEALQRIDAALEKELVAYEILEQLLESEDYGDWTREAILGARWKISIAIFYEEDYSKKVLERNIDKLQRTLSVLGIEPDGGNDGDIPVPSVGAYNPAALSLHELVINLIEGALTEKAEALERIDAALEKERKAYELLEQMLISGDYGDWNRLDILRAKSRIYVAIKYEEYLKKVLMIITVDKLEDSLSVLGVEPDEGSD